MNTNITNKTRIVGLLFMFLISNGGFAKNHSLSNDTVKFNSEIQIILTPTLFQGFKISSFGNDKLLESNFAPALDLGLEYGVTLSKRFSVTLGAHWGNIPEHYKFDVRPTDFYEVFNRNISSNNRTINSQYIYFPLYGSYLKTLNNHKQFKISTGLAFNRLYSFEHSFSYGYGINNSGEPMPLTDPKLLFEASYQSTTEFFVSGILKVGIRKNLMNKNVYFDYGLKLNWAANPVGEGQYSFYNLPENDYGNLAFRFNYIGFELAIGMCNCRNK